MNLRDELDSLTDRINLIRERLSLDPEVAITPGYRLTLQHPTGDVVLRHAPGGWRLESGRVHSDAGYLSAGTPTGTHFIGRLSTQRGHQVPEPTPQAAATATGHSGGAAGIQGQHITAARVLATIPYGSVQYTPRDIATRLGAATDTPRRRRIRHLLHAAWRLGLATRTRAGAKHPYEYRRTTATATPAQLLAADTLATLTLGREPTSAYNVAVALHHGNGQPDATGTGVLGAMRYLAVRHLVTAVATSTIDPAFTTYQAVAG